MKLGRGKQFHQKDFEKKRYLTDIKLIAPLREEKAQQYAILVFTLVSLALFGLFAINPTLTTILELRKKLEDSELVNSKLDKKITDLSSLQREYSFLEDDLPHVYAAIPEEPNVAELLGKIQALASDEDITILDIQSFPAPIRPGKKVKKENDPSFDFSLQVAGSYEDMQNFLRTLSAFDRITTITSVTIDKEGTGENGGIEMTVRGKAYYRYEN